MRFGVGSVGAPQPASEPSAIIEIRTRRMGALLRSNRAFVARRCQGERIALPRIMRIVCLAALIVPLLALGGCTRATVIGTPCIADKDCNVKGQRCVAGLNGGASICTHACTGQTGESGCPIGYDCPPSHPANRGELTGNKETFAFDAATGTPLLFGKDCALQQGTTQADWDPACADSGDPAANPTCRHARDPSSRLRVPLKGDPHAYCTGSCASDADCPVDMLCGLDYDNKQKCLRRGFCDPCLINDNCVGENNVCVPTADGSARYCSKSCGGNYDCGGVQGHFLSCSDATDSLGNAGTYCLHKFGACVGTGEICDPCRSNDDCTKSNTRCLANIATGERMCTKSCTMDSECASNKPTGCDYGPPPSRPLDPIYTNLCTGDAEHFNGGVFTCFF